MTPDPSARGRRLPNRFLRWAIDPWMDWLAYWLDLKGRNGRPDHGKVLSTFAFFLGCTGIVASSSYLLIEKPSSPESMLAFILAYSALVFSLPFGLAGFKVWATTKGGGTVDAAAATFEEQIAAALQAASPEGRERPEGD